ncbi:hypothetical protein GCM10010992_02660 [Cloacibacterium rupense]|uniref:Uncharacterized protein n=1 Tax=Cloacibacterium rupense TaxID=517423 RepID=A0ABQ2NGJ5_9FLAO|nr:hypothetical protein GCM10010992_02660 [Cloacibacterium rupense]
MKETSGLTFLRDQLYTFNDSGNTNEIFEIDKNNGKILKKFKTNFPNKDWEAITNDGESLYIGDFGNNAGSRKDLAIYKTSPFCDNISSVDTDLKFQFNYSEQKDFIVNYLNHDFDAEAMIFLDGNIHLFTKEWASKNISHYIISVQSTENQTISKLESYETGFVVTDASYFEGKLYVVGYTKKAKVYLMVFEENQDGLFFSEPLKKYKLGSALTIGQVEGIAVNKDGIYISNERFVKLIFNAKQSLYFIPFHQLK